MPIKPTQCPKCKGFHGNDWSQCKGICPMAMSPHFDPTWRGLGPSQKTSDKENAYQVLGNPQDDQSSKAILVESINAEEMNLKIETGKYYVDRTGAVHGPMRANGDEKLKKAYPWEVEGCAICWTSDGYRWSTRGPDSFDLVAEYIEEQPALQPDVLREPAGAALSDKMLALTAENALLRDHVEQLQSKINTTNCACSYDNPDEVCKVHSPKVEALTEENARLRDENALQAARIEANSALYKELLLKAQYALDQSKRLQIELDHADRRAGAAERRNKDLQDSVDKRRSWRDNANRQRGYSTNVSFDRVWEDTCRLADIALSAQKSPQAVRLREMTKTTPAGAERADTLCKAIMFALDHKCGDGLEWLRDWFEGERAAMAELDAALSQHANKEQGE